MCFPLLFVPHESSQPELSCPLLEKDHPLTLKRSSLFILPVQQIYWLEHLAIFQYSWNMVRSSCLLMMQVRSYSVKEMFSSLLELLLQSSVHFLTKLATSALTLVVSFVNRAHVCFFTRDCLSFLLCLMLPPMSPSSSDVIGLRPASHVSTFISASTTGLIRIL